MKKYTYLFLVILIISCSKQQQKETNSTQIVLEKKTINTLLNNWHKDAAEANFDVYFNAMSSTSIFIGTDAAENWNLEAFKSFSKPHFDNGKAWSFDVINRNVYLDATSNIAWFDELLNTWMGVCRGSGVLKKENNSWKIEHYVLSLTIPNDNTKAVKKLNHKQDSIFLKRFKK